MRLGHACKTCASQEIQGFPCGGCFFRTRAVSGSDEIEDLGAANGGTILSTGAGPHIATGKRRSSTAARHAPIGPARGRRALATRARGKPGERTGRQIAGRRRAATGILAGIGLAIVRSPAEGKERRSAARPEWTRARRSPVASVARRACPVQGAAEAGPAVQGAAVDPGAADEGANAGETARRT